MSITLGVFDIFTYAIPGSVYLALMVYLGSRFHWLEPARLLSTNTVLVVTVAALICYLIGHITYSIGRFLAYPLRIWTKETSDAREEFVSRVPAARGRSFVEADRAVLLAAVEVHYEGAALEILRLRAIGLMLRNCSLWQAGRLTHWANLKTLELAFWVPGIDDAIGRPVTPQPPTVQPAE